MSKDQKTKTSIFSKIIIIPVLVIIVLILIALARETYKKNQIQAEIEGLKEKARQIDKANTEIQDKITYLESQDYQEKEAKDKFNLQDPDENVVVIKPSMAKKEPAEEKKSESIRVEEGTINIPIKWWQYFFKN